MWRNCETRKFEQDDGQLVNAWTRYKHVLSLKKDEELASASLKRRLDSKAIKLGMSQIVSE